MEKQSSYQKLKAKNIKLENDIYKIIMDENSMNSIELKAMYAMKFDTQKAMMFGELPIKNRSGNGILNVIKEAKEYDKGGFNLTNFYDMCAYLGSSSSGKLYVRSNGINYRWNNIKKIWQKRVFFIWIKCNDPINENNS